MAEEESRAVGDSVVDDARMKLTCSHGGGHLRPCGPGGALRYVGGQTRVLVVPRAVSFRDLAARLTEMAGGAEVRAVMHRLADEGLEDVIVSVTSDEELAHMRDEYDRLRATRPAARFRLFVTTSAPGFGGGIAEQRRATQRMRRVQSEQVLVMSAQLHRLSGGYPVPIRRVQSAHELVGVRRVQLLCFHHQGHQCRGVCQRQDVRAPEPAMWMCALPYMSKKSRGVSVAETARSRDAKSTMDFDKGRAIWEFE